MLLESDGEEHPLEEMFIQDVGKRLGLTLDEIAQLNGVPDIAFSLPESEKEKMELFYESFFLMKMDSSISTKEEETLHQIGGLLRINPMMVQDFINIGHQYIKSPIPENVLLNILKKYLN